MSSWTLLIISLFFNDVNFFFHFLCEFQKLFPDAWKWSFWYFTILRCLCYLHLLANIPVDLLIWHKHRPFFTFHWAILGEKLILTFSHYIFIYILSVCVQVLRYICNTLLLIIIAVKWVFVCDFIIIFLIAFQLIRIYSVKVDFTSWHIKSNLVRWFVDYWSCGYNLSQFLNRVSFEHADLFLG